MKVILSVFVALFLMTSSVLAEQSVEEIQIATFAKRADVIAALKELGGAFKKVREENAIGDIQPLKDAVMGYYKSQFGEEYKKKNNGKEADITAMFNQLSDDSVALQYYYIPQNSNPLGSKHLLDKSDDKSTWSASHGKYHPALREYLNSFGLYDIFLVNNDGDVVYTCFKELDFTTNLKSGLYASSDLGVVYKKVIEGSKDTTMLSEMKPYLPSYDAPARFVAAGVYEGETKLGVVIFQLPTGM